MKDHWTCVKEFLASPFKDQIVEIEPYKYSSMAQKVPSNVCKTVKIRLIKHVNRSGEVKVFATSLLDEKQYSRQSIINLYKERWGVEEAYKTLKSRLDVIHFSGKTLQAVQQDFYANALLISLASILKASIPITRKKTQIIKKEAQNPEQRTPMINNTYAIYQVKRLLKKMFFQHDHIVHWINQFEDLVSSAIEYSRKGQSYHRDKYKGRERSFSQNYKPI